MTTITNDFVTIENIIKHEIHRRKKQNKTKMLNISENSKDVEMDNMSSFKKKKKKKKGHKKMVQNDENLTNDIATLEVEKFYNVTCYENDKHLIKDKIMDSNLNEEKITKMISIANTSAGDSLYDNCTFKKKKKKKKGDKKMVQNDEYLTNEIGTLEVEKLYNETCYKSDNHLNKDNTRVSDLNEVLDELTGIIPITNASTDDSFKKKKKKKKDDKKKVQNNNNLKTNTIVLNTQELYTETFDDKCYKDKTGVSNLNKDKLTKMISTANTSAGDSLYDNCTFKKKKKKKKGDKKMVQIDENLTNEIGTLEVEKLYNETSNENDKHLIKDKIMDSNLNEDKLTKKISSANTSAGDSLLKSRIKKTKKNKKKSKMVITEYIESPKYESMRKNLKNVEYLNKDISESPPNEIKNDPAIVNIPYSSRISNIHEQYPELFQKLLRKKKKDMKKSIKALSSRKVMSPNKSNKCKRQTTDKDYSKKNSTQSVDMEEETFHDTNNYNGEESGNKLDMFDAQDDSTPDYGTMTDIGMSLGQYNQTPYNPNGIQGRENFLSGNTHLQCDFCFKTFISKSKLNQHRRTHTGEKPYACNVCGRSFSLQGTLNEHTRTHTGEKPYACNVCGRSFSQRGTLIDHTRTHTGEKPYACKICGRSFSIKVNLITHTRTHTGEKPYACNVCGRSFSQRGTLIDHTRTHTGEKPYACNVCGRSFSQRGNLIVHFRIHSGERPFECGQCEKKFSSSSDRLKHTRRVHIKCF